MGQQNIVYGYIETAVNRNKKWEEIVNNYKFDDTYPFTNIFSRPIKGYQSDIISFAGSYKSLEEDWDEWLKKFETFIAILPAKSAIVRLETELEGEIFSINYLKEVSLEPMNVSDINKTKWKRWIEDSEGNVKEEEIFL